MYLITPEVTEHALWHAFPNKELYPAWEPRNVFADHIKKELNIPEKGTEVGLYYKERWFEFGGGPNLEYWKRIFQLVREAGYVPTIVASSALWDDESLEKIKKQFAGTGVTVLSFEEWRKRSLGWGREVF